MVRLKQMSPDFVIPERRPAANPEPMNTGRWKMGSGFLAAPTPGMTILERDQSI